MEFQEEAIATYVPRAFEQCNYLKLLGLAWSLGERPEAKSTVVKKLPDTYLQSRTIIGFSNNFKYLEMTNWASK